MTGAVRVTGSGLQLGDELLPVWSAEMHYWRLDPADWPRVLDAVVSLGFTCVSSYVPWSRHERPDGSFDFTGALDVERFWSLAAERGLRVIARPGPNCGAELEDSGWPRRVLDDPDCQARRPDGRGYLLPTSTHHAFMPSFASRATLAAIAGWYDVIAPRVAAQLWPAGPIVAVQVDNEMGYHFQSHPFAMDYHPDAIEQWREWRGVDAEPPRDRRDGTEDDRVAWVAFREHHLRRSIATLAEMLRQRGIDRVPLLHNDYPRTTTPFDSGALEASAAVDVATGDVYASRHGGRFVRDYARHLSGTSVLPWLAEAGVGWITLPWLLPMAVDPADAEHNLWRALSGGVRAFNVFMAVERDRWYGAAISARGELREPHATAYRRVHEVLRAHDWGSLRRRPPVLLVENRDESRRAAAQAVAGDLVPPFAQVLPLDPRLFAPGTAESRRIERWVGDVRSALDTHGVDWDEAASSSLPDLSAYDVVVVAARDSLAEEARVALAKAEAAGVMVVSDDIALADVRWPQPGWRADHESVDVTYFVRDDGSGTVLCINGSADRVTARIVGPSTFDVDLTPWGVHVQAVPA